MPDPEHLVEQPPPLWRRWMDRLPFEEVRLGLELLVFGLLCVLFSPLLVPAYFIGRVALVQRKRKG